MNIIVSNTSEKPIYQQLYDQICAQIIKGELSGGYCLPPIRQAALELSVSVITVKKAWEELERHGFIHTVTGKGCFVAHFTSDEILQKRNDLIVNKMQIDISYYKSFGITVDEVIALIKKIY